ncbi:MAG: hypothetical protein RLZZ546_844 [Bacteroidota bacterium]
MRAVIQRVSMCRLFIDEKEFSNIDRGVLILLGIEEDDNDQDLEWLAQKILQMRIFGDNEGKMNLSVQDIDGHIMVVSQFTLYASVKKGNRPGFTRSAKPEFANPIYEKFIEYCKNHFSGKISTGVFGADMKISLLNDGPVTIIIDTKNKE